MDELATCTKEHSNIHRDINTALKAYALRRGLSYVDLHELACNESECPVLDEAGQLMFIDQWHRSAFGDAWLAKRVREKHIFARILGTPPL